MESSKPAIRVDLNDFKLHLRLRNKDQLTLHFNSPSRRFYLSVIALLVNEMKNAGKIKTISLKEHLDLLVLLNDSVGGAAGSSDKESLLTRIYVKWKNALPNLEEAPLFKVLGKKKEEGDGGIGRIYLFTDSEKDGWANLFDYIGSKENVRLKFAIDKVGVGLRETSIIFEDYLNGDAWHQFISSLKKVACVERMKYPLPDKPSIAVMPFANMSEDPKQEFLCDGMAEDLITDLSKISGLMVIARNSTFPYKGKPVQVKQVAEELGVRYVLEGSVRRAGEEIRINAQLVDSMTGYHLWAERYDGTIGKIFVLQDQITEKIVSALAVKLSLDEKERLGQKGTNNIIAYDAYLEGWDHFYRYTPHNMGKAVASFKKAVELDPNYGQAYAGLARVYFEATQSPSLLSGFNMSPLEARLRVREYTQMAMNKPPTSSAYQVSALLYLRLRQHAEAISGFEQGLALDPNSPGCNLYMGWALTMAGMPEEGVGYLNKSIRLDPRDRYKYLARLSWAHFCMGEIAEAVTLMEQALRLSPEEVSNAAVLSGFYGALGRVQEARAMVELRKKYPNAPSDIGITMFLQPFRDRMVADRYAQGCLKAGWAPEKISGGYFPAFKENQLIGEEIKSLLFGSRITGSSISDGQQWLRNYDKNGKFTSRGSPTSVESSFDNGKIRIEGDMIWHRFEKSYWGLGFCGTVFRNPRGTNESKDEYFFCSDIGFTPFSVVR